MAYKEVRGLRDTDRAKKEMGPQCGTSQSRGNMNPRKLNQYFSFSLSQPNHLLSAPPVFVKVFFHNTQDLQLVRRELLPLATTNSAKLNAIDAYAEVVSADAQDNGFGAAMEIGYGQDDEYANPGETSRAGARAAWGAESSGMGKGKGKDRDPQDCVVDLREHDIAYYLRVAIDLGTIHSDFS